MMNSEDNIVTSIVDKSKKSEENRIPIIPKKQYFLKRYFATSAPDGECTKTDKRTNNDKSSDLKENRKSKEKVGASTANVQFWNENKPKVCITQKTVKRKPESQQKDKKNLYGCVNPPVLILPDVDTATKQCTKTHCPNCNEDFKVILYKTRCLRCNGPLKFICLNCEKSFDYGHTLRIHLRNNHVAVTALVKCLKCNKKFMRRKYMTEHRKVCDQQPVFNCTHCSYTSYSKVNLNQHIRCKHSGQVYNCHYCQRRYSSLGTLTRHVKYYCRKNKPLNCHHCEYKCYKKDQLIDHLKWVHFYLFKTYIS